MFAGERINNTEGRAVQALAAARADAARAAIPMPARGARHARRDARLRRAACAPTRAITDVVNIGIGGSDLGPQMAVLALDEFVMPGKRFHFVSNVDGHELAAVLRSCSRESTLFLDRLQDLHHASRR